MFRPKTRSDPPSRSIRELLGAEVPACDVGEDPPELADQAVDQGIGVARKPVRPHRPRCSGAMTSGTGRGPDMLALITRQIDAINPDRISGLRY